MTVTWYDVAGLKTLGKNVVMSVKVAVPSTSLSIRSVLFSFSPILVSPDDNQRYAVAVATRRRLYNCKPYTFSSLNLDLS